MVCGFVAPPKQFQDPNVDLHKQLDLRQQQQNMAPGAMPQSPGQAAVPGGMDPTLTCPNCGFETSATPPESVDTADPQGMPSNDPQQPDAEQLDAEQGDVEDLDAQEGEPQEGDPTQDPEDPENQLQDEPTEAPAAEGDLCPNCGKAPLESANVLEETGGMPPNSDGIPDADEMPGENDAVGDGPVDDEDLDDQDPEQGPGDSPEDPSSDEPGDPDEGWPDDNDEDEDEDGIPDDEEEDEPRKARPPR